MAQQNPPSTIPGTPSTPRQAPAWWRSRTTMTIAIILVLLALGSYAVWAFWLAKDDPAENLITAPVVRGDLEDTITATGTLQPKEFVDVGTQVSGQLKRVHVEIGSVVKAKDLLAEIDPSVYLAKVDADRAQLRNQAAQLTDRQAQFTLAELQFTRQKNMDREGATTAEALQGAEAAQRSARAQIEAVKAQMQQIESTLRGDEASLGYTKIYAPIAGTVVSQAAKQGQTLNANQQAPIVLRIADLSTMTVQAQVSEADVSKLRPGMDVYFTTLGDSRRRYYGQLRQVSPTPVILNNVVLYDALFDVPNPNQALMTQMTAQVFFVAASAKGALYVPVAAIQGTRRAGGEAGKAGGRRSGAAAADGGASRSAPSGVEGDGRRGGAAVADGGSGRGAATADGGAARGAPSGVEGGGRRGGGSSAAGAEQGNRGGRSQASVRVVHPDGRIEERAVQVGVTTRVSAQIISGLAEGELVVTGTRAVDKPAAPRSTSPMAPAQGGRR